LKDKISDNRLHIIAPPGSGKTVLGLEVMRRINKPAIILAPTIAIRDQWIERFVDLFMDDCGKSSWISNDIKSPEFLTVTTYQALHSAMSGLDMDETGDSEEDILSDDDGPKRCFDTEKAGKLIKVLTGLGIQTVVVDEAHHLRSEWWKSLNYLKDNLKKPVIVALTATPPYDATPVEWERYISLCGPVDDEIFVPELVKLGELCPHQDYIYFSYPSDEEAQSINTFRKAVDDFTEALNKDDEFLHALMSHPCLEDPEGNIETILKNPAYYSSIAIFLKYNNARGYEKLLTAMGTNNEKIPGLNLEWLEILLNGCIFEDNSHFDEGMIKRIKQHLSGIGAVEKRKVNLLTTEKIKKSMVSSINKLDSINKIVEIESNSLKKDLRMVILSDYIRGYDMPKDSDDIKPITKMGVVPIFELLRRSRKQNINLGVLSGSLVIIPESSEGTLLDIIDGRGIDRERVELHPLKHDEDFLTFEIKGQDQEQTVQIITELFTAGGITVLVGTKSLLGEGWDAPCINSLILASFIGSYMLSNQMRGRAIRVWPGDPKKTANIWHLICMEPGERGSNYDFELLCRRFKAFVGVSFDGLTIENGIGRFSLPRPPYSKGSIERLNRDMVERAMDRESLREKWNMAVKTENGRTRLTEEIRFPEDIIPRGMFFRNTIKSVLWEGLSIAMVVFAMIARNISISGDGKITLMFLAAVGGISMLAAMPKFLKAAYLFIKYGPVESCVKQIGDVLLKSLIFSEDIQSNISDLKIKVEKGENGAVSISLRGSTTHESNLFVRCMEEILGLVNNPRYLIVRESSWGLVKREDYHSAPALLGANERTASFFFRAWKSTVGPCRLIYTRSTDGRRVLLKARVRSLSAAFVKPPDRISCWK
jgi:DNA or RNA helicases of superfamily II